MKRAIIITVAVSFFLIFTFYSYSTVPYVPGISPPTFESYSPAYINKTVAGVSSSIIVYNYNQIVKRTLMGVPSTGATFTTLFFINVISESKNLNPVSLGLRVIAVSGYIENSSAPFKLPIIDFSFGQSHKNNVIIVAFNFTFPFPPSSFHSGEYVSGNYTATFNITIALTPTLLVYHGSSSNYVASVEYPIVME